MATKTPEEAQKQIVNTVREFVRRDVLPVVDKYEAEDIVPLDLIEQMKQMGLLASPYPRSTADLVLITPPSP